MSDVETYNALPKQIQQAVARDWLERTRNGNMRAAGIASHFAFLMWIAADYEIPFGDLVGFDNN